MPEAYRPETQKPLMGELNKEPYQGRVDYKIDHHYKRVEGPGK